jgi:hypothetical protein
LGNSLTTSPKSDDALGDFIQAHQKEWDAVPANTPVRNESSEFLLGQVGKEIGNFLKSDERTASLVDTQELAKTRNGPLPNQSNFKDYLNAVNAQRIAGAELDSQDIATSKVLLFYYQGYSLVEEHGTKAQLAGNLDDQYSPGLGRALHSCSESSDSEQRNRYDFYSNIQTDYAVTQATRGRSVQVIRDNRSVQINWTRDFSTWAAQVGVSADEALRKTDFEVYQGIIDAAFDTVGVKSVDINGAWRPSFSDYKAAYQEMKNDPNASQQAVATMGAVVSKYSAHPWSQQHVTSWAVDINSINGIDVNNKSHHDEPALVRDFTNNLVDGNDGGIVWGPWRMWNNTNGTSYNNKGANTDQSRHNNHIHYGLR